MNGDAAVPNSPAGLRAFQPQPGRLMARGHAAGDLLEAYNWRPLEESDGRLKLHCHLPAAVKNPRGQLFGGFTATYVDLIALLTCRAGAGEAHRQPRWLTTVNMRIDYIEPVVNAFTAESVRVHRRGKMYWVETQFQNESGALLVFAWTTLREIG